MAIPRIIAGLLSLVVTATAWLPAPSRSQPAPVNRLVVAAAATPTSYDPEMFLPGGLETLNNIYEGLVRYTPRTDITGTAQSDLTRMAPGIAESWTVSADGLVWRFKLREGVRSPFGNELTSDDLIWGTQRTMASNRNGAFNLRLAGFDRIAAISRYEVEYTLKAPSRIFLMVMANSSPAIFDTTEVRRHATAEDPFANAWIARNTASFGPYHMQSSRPGEGAVFVANPNYYREQPYFRQILYREVPSPAARAALVRSGQAQWAEAMPMQQLIELMNDPRVKVESVPGLGSATARMNPRFPPFDDIRVRQAIQYATDYDAIGRIVFEGRARRSRSILAPEIPGAIEASRYDTDVSRARALLAEAGFANGIDIELSYSSNFWWEEAFAIQLRDSLARAGIRLALKRLPPVEMAARRAPGVNSIPFLTHLTNPSVADAGFTLALSAQTRGVTNVHGYSSPPLDALIGRISAEPDDARWAALVAEAQQIVANDATYVETFFPGVYEVMAACISGYFWRPVNRPQWYPLSCSR